MSTPAPLSNGTVDAAGTYSSQQLDQLSKQSKTTDKEKHIITWTKDAYQRCKTLRQQIERQWYVNLAFYTGRQNISAVPVNSSNSAGTRLYVPPAPYYRSRPVFNRIRPIVRKELAKLISQKPSASIVPATSDEQDQSAARAGEQIWESTFNRKRIKVAHRQAQLWALTTGVGFVKSYWDPNTVDTSQPPPQPQINPTTGQPEMIGPTGDFAYDVVTPFHLYIPDMLATDIEDQPYVIHVTTRSCDWIKMHYPGVNPAPNVVEANDILNDSFLNLVGAADNRKNAVMCYEVWIKPGHVDFMPDGGMFSIVGDRIVQYVEKNPYIHDQYPFVKLDHIPTSRFYSDSIITDLVPVQREYNRTRGQIIENKNKMAHIQLLAAEGSVDASKITTEPGQVIQFKLGFPAPTPMPLQSIPAYVIQELSQQLLDFDDISGQHDVSKGQTPTGVTAATAINFLQEQDDTMLAPTFQSIEEFYEKLAFQTLCYVKQYWDIPRTVKVAGRDKQFDVMAFKGSDLRSNTDVSVEAGSALPTSKAAKQAFLMDLMQMGFIPPEKGLELMEMGGSQELYEQMQIDSSQAKRENMKMSNVTPQIMEQYMKTFMGTDPTTGAAMLVDPNTGQQLGVPDPNTGQIMPTAPPLIVPVNSFDAHQTHISIHNNYRKSQEYDNLPPEIKSLFEEHVNQHMAALGIPPGTPDPTTNQPPIPMDQSGAPTDPNAAPNAAPDANAQTPTSPAGTTPPGASVSGPDISQQLPPGMTMGG